jgi:hypothetical protein
MTTGVVLPKRLQNLFGIKAPRSNRRFRAAPLISGRRSHFIHLDSCQRVDNHHCRTLAAAGFFAKCSISARLPNSTSPASRNPGAQTVTGRETKSEQDRYVRQHRMFPHATRRQLAIVVPSQAVIIRSFSDSSQRSDNTARRSASRAALVPPSKRAAAFGPILGRHF